MIRTYVIPCDLKRIHADSINLNSGRIYSGIVSRHWRLLKQKGLWLSEKSLTKLSDLRLANKDIEMHAHTIDAAQQGFFKACKTTRALRKAGFPEANFPWRSKKFRTTTWKNTGVKFKGSRLELSTGAGNAKILVKLPESLWSMLRFLEVRLVFDKKARKYVWHVVAENGYEAKEASGTNTVSVDLGEIHPAVVGDEVESTIIACRARRHQAQGHAKRLAKLAATISRKKKGSRRYSKLVRAKSRMKAHHRAVVRDMEHKISRAIVDVAVERKANTIAMGDIRDIGDEVNLGKQSNQKISGWNHGQIQKLVEYKAEAEGIKLVMVDEHYTSKTCPQCQHRHKPRGRNFKCPVCKFQSHRDVVGQINILSVFKTGTPGNIPAPSVVKHRIPYNIRVMRRRLDTGQIDPVGQSVARAVVAREAAGF